MERGILDIMEDLQSALKDHQRLVNAEKPQWCYICDGRLSYDEALKGRNVHDECDPTTYPETDGED